MKNIIRKLSRGGLFALALVLILITTGCSTNMRTGVNKGPSDGASELISFDSTVNLIDDSSQAGGAKQSPSATEPSTEATNASTEASTQSQVTAQAPETDVSLPDENGTYTSKQEVALYLHTYGKLPSNFITKKEAKKLGWTGGNVEDYAPGKSIGGDYFGNYEGLLPEDKTYHECDIDTLGKSSRGAKRIIYSDDGYIYYTEDHYESFELLYEGE